MSQYMLMFSLGPVQSFIAQARKTRDLWLGSFLLSILMESGMKDIPIEALVFPADKVIDNVTQKNIPDLPNKFVAIFDDLDEAQRHAKQCKENIKDCWQGICNDIWAEIIQGHVGTNDLEFVRTIWHRQTNPETFFEIFWVITEGNTTEYSAWLERTQQALDARKRLRNFSAQLPGEQGEKSTISGEREALHGRGKSRAEVKKFWQVLTKQKDFSSRDISKDGDERLDAIDTVKRFAYQAQTLQQKKLDASFPSTSSVATATFVEGLLRGRVDNNIIKEWINATEKLADASPESIPFLYNISKRVTQGHPILKRDGDCYFQETFTLYRLKKDYNQSQDTSNELAKNGLEALRPLVKTAKLVDISPPTSYYVMIQMDGDKMGTLLSGVEDLEEHQDISRKLSEFSRKVVPSLVEQYYPGRLVYAGGDDVFALAPLARDSVNVQPGEVSTVLDLVNKLQQQYHDTVANAVRGDERKKQVTASTGIAISHHFTALSYVRRMTKEAEEAAKKHYRRNALVVTILRRSGEQTRVGCHWYYDGLDTEEQPVRLFTNFYNWFIKNQLSPKCVYILLEEAVTLVKLPPEAQQSEIKRVLTRQRTDKDNLSDEAIKLAAERLVKLAQEMDNELTGLTNTHEQLSVELHSDTRRYGLVEVLGWLLVMDFLTRKGEE
jgi:CRISPR-associated protein Cmr2